LIIFYKMESISHLNSETFTADSQESYSKPMNHLHTFQRDTMLTVNIELSRFDSNSKEFESGGNVDSPLPKKKHSDNYL